MDRPREESGGKVKKHNLNSLIDASYIIPGKRKPPLSRNRLKEGKGRAGSRGKVLFGRDRLLGSDVDRRAKAIGDDWVSVVFPTPESGFDTRAGEG